MPRGGAGRAGGRGRRDAAWAPALPAIAEWEEGDEAGGGAVGRSEAACASAGASAAGSSGRWSRGYAAAGAGARGGAAADAEMVLARRVSPCRVSTVCKTRDVAQSVNKNATNYALSTGTLKSGGSARLVWARRAPQASSSRLILGAVEMPFRRGCARSTHEPRECLAAAPAFVAITTRSACSRTDAAAAAPAAPQPPWEWHVGLRGSRRSETVAPVSGGAAAGAGARTTEPAAGQRPLSLPLLPMPP